jgi:hypothetical protein
VAQGQPIIRWLQSKRVGAVLLNGYNDPARLRICAGVAKRQIPVLLFGDATSMGTAHTGLKSPSETRAAPARVAEGGRRPPLRAIGTSIFRKYGVPSTDIFYSPYET